MHHPYYFCRQDMKQSERVQWFSELESTNDYLMKHYRTLDSGYVVAAYNQTAGKGLAENYWYSVPGQSLTFSYLLSPGSVPAGQQYLISMATALALRDYVAGATSRNVWIKWPNDILVEDQKIAGILIQHYVMGEEILASIIGAGLNLNQQDFPPDLPNPVSLSMISKEHYEPHKALQAVIENLDYYLQPRVLKSPKVLTEQYLSHLYRYRRWERYIIRGKEVKAMIQGITGLGMLVLTDETGMEYQCDIKEVVYLY